jgi:hypothetical protein
MCHPPALQASCLSHLLSSIHNGICNTLPDPAHMQHVYVRVNDANVAMLTSLYGIYLYVHTQSTHSTKIDTLNVMESCKLCWQARVR